MDASEHPNFDPPKPGYLTGRPGRTNQRQDGRVAAPIKTMVHT
jgi:hypothetical protein